MNDIFVERTKKLGTIRGRKLQVKWLKQGVKRKGIGRLNDKLGVEVHRSTAEDGFQTGLGTEGNKIRRLTSESSPVEQGKI